MAGVVLTDDNIGEGPPPTFGRRHPTQVCRCPLNHPKDEDGLRRIALLLNLSTLIGQLSHLRF